MYINLNTNNSSEKLWRGEKPPATSGKLIKAVYVPYV
jgi:hypothetical protein